MHKCFSYPLKAGNKEHILRELGPVVSSPAAVQRCATLRSPAPLSAGRLRRWGSASPRDHTISYPSLHHSLLIFKSIARTSGEGKDLAALSPYLDLTCQIIQVESFMLRHHLLENGLDFPLCLFF